MDGYVDTHFWERFGTAIFLSIIKDSIQTFNAQATDGSVIVGDSAESGEKVVEKILDATANIPPTLIKNQGESIQVMVARDLDFSSVYELEIK
jgi:type IV secretion system protein VirB10